MSKSSRSAIINSIDDANRYAKSGSQYAQLGLTIEESIHLLERAVSIYNDHNNTHKNLISIYKNLGISYLEQGDKNKALAQFDAALEVIEHHEAIDSINEDLFSICQILRSSYHNQSNKNKALEQFELSDSIHENLMSIYKDLGVSYLNQGNKNKAIEKFDAVLGIAQLIEASDSPLCASCLIYKGHINRSKPGSDNKEEAFQNYLDASTILKSTKPNSFDLANCHYNMAQIANSQKKDISILQHNYNAALKILTTKRPNDNLTALCYQGLAQSQLKTDNIGSAISNFQSSIDTFNALPSNSKIIHSHIGLCNAHMNRYDSRAALGAAQDALAVYDEQKHKNLLPQLHLNLGNIYDIKGDKDKSDLHNKAALESADRLLQTNPDNKSAQNIKKKILTSIHREQGEKASAAGDAQTAYSSYRELLAINPNDRSALYRAIDLFATDDSPTKHIKIIEILAQSDIFSGNTAYNNDDKDYISDILQTYAHSLYDHAANQNAENYSHTFAKSCLEKSQQIWQIIKDQNSQSQEQITTICELDNILTAQIEQLQQNCLQQALGNALVFPRLNKDKISRDDKNDYVLAPDAHEVLQKAINDNWNIIEPVRDQFPFNEEVATLIADSLKQPRPFGRRSGNLIFHGSLLTKNPNIDRYFGRQFAKIAQTLTPATIKSEYQESNIDKTTPIPSAPIKPEDRISNKEKQFEQDQKADLKEEAPIQVAVAQPIDTSQTQRQNDIPVVEAYYPENINFPDAPTNFPQAPVANRPLDMNETKEVRKQESQAL